jgi:hypothetical protein
MLIFKKQPRLFKSSLLAGGLHTHKDVVGRQDLGQAVHDK